MRITVAIPTCIWPRGCKLGVESALAEVEHARTYGHEVQVVVCMDGNAGYQRLDQTMPELFQGIDKCSPGNPTDAERIPRDNGDVPDYEWLRPYEEDGAVKVIRNATNIGAYPNFNVALKSGFATDFTLLLMDDEWLLPGCLSWMAEVFRQYPNVVLAGYSNTAQAPEPLFSGIKAYDDLMSAAFYRGIWIRELFLERGWVFNEAFHMVSGDGYMVKDVRWRGNDIAFVAEPRLVDHSGHHKSLGKWQFDNIMADRETAQRIGDPITHVDDRLMGGYLYLRMAFDEPRVVEQKRNAARELTHWDDVFNPRGLA